MVGFTGVSWKTGQANFCSTGAFSRAGQNPLILPGWTLPGVITAGAAQSMINVQRVLPGHKAVIIGIDPQTDWKELKQLRSQH